jgi:hypothetical protein
MTSTWRMPVLVCRCVKVGGASPLDPVTVASQQLLLPGDPEEAVLPNPVDSSRRRRPSPTPTPSLRMCLSSAPTRAAGPSMRSSPAPSTSYPTTSTTPPYPGARPAGCRCASCAPTAPAGRRR